MKLNTSKFMTSSMSDFDTHVTYRTLVGNMTEARLDRLNLIARRYNEANEAPYGVSPNGYAYRCGHEHDCCGCIIHNFMEVERVDDGAWITIVKTYNL